MLKNIFKKIIKVVDKIIAIIFFSLITLAVMIRMDKPDWIISSINWFIITYLIFKFVIIEKKIEKNIRESSSLKKKFIYIIDKLFTFQQLGWWLVATLSAKGDNFIYSFIILLVIIYLFGKYILLKN